MSEGTAAVRIQPAIVLRDEIKELIEQGDLDQAIRRLLDFTRDYTEGREFENEAVAISAQFNRTRRHERSGMRTSADAEVDYTQITVRLLDLTDTVYGQLKAVNGRPLGLLSSEGTSTEGHPVGSLENNGDAPGREPVLQPEFGDGALTQLERARARFRREREREASEVTDVVFRCRDLKKAYPRSRHEFALSGVELELRTGQITVVVGVNGVGKTTLLRIVAGELKPSTGTLEYPLLDRGGLDWQTIRSKIGYVQQSPPPWHGRVCDNLHLHASYRGLHGRENIDETEFILHRLGLELYRNATWSQLAGGFKMRFELARLLIEGATLLILDEPLAPLDIIAQQIFLRDLRDLANSIQKPLSVILSSQHLYEIDAIADQILFLNEGKSTFYGPPARLGEFRATNVFELSGPSSFSEVQRLLNGTTGLQVKVFGNRFVVTVGRTVTGPMVLQRILQGGGSVNYFRDISRSTRLLLETYRHEE